MRRAAIPKEVAEIGAASFSDAPPGHKFTLYFQCWSTGWCRTRSLAEPLGDVCSVSSSSHELLKNLRQRQCWLADLREDTTTLHVRTRSPLVTGMGNPHPSENGFTFTNPHGVPVLPGSSLKGLLRRAAEELALFHNSSAWTIPAVWALFGLDATAAYLRTPKRGARGAFSHERETELWRKAYLDALNQLSQEDLELCALLFGGLDSKEIGDALEALPDSTLLANARNRGELLLWDAYPKAERLEIDVMASHYADYYAGTDVPKDSSDVKPVFFLAIPTDTTITIHVQYAGHGPDNLAASWQALVSEVAAYAFDWVGFGAKTAAGYGRATLDEEAARQHARERQARNARIAREREAARLDEERKARQQRLEGLDPVDRMVEELADCDENRASEIYAELKNTDMDAGAKRHLAEALRDAYKRFGKWSGKLSKKQKEKNASIRQLLEE